MKSAESTRIVERLREIHGLSTPQQVDEYAGLIARLAAKNLEPSLLPDLLQSFYDDTDNEEAMWGLLHLVERYPPEVLAKELLAQFPFMSRQAALWTRIVHRRIFFSAKYFPAYRAQLRRMGPAARRPVLEFLKKAAAEEDPQFAARLSRVDRGSRTN